MSLRKLWEIVKDRESLHAAVHGVTKSMSNRTTTERERQWGSKVKRVLSLENHLWGGSVSIWKECVYLFHSDGAWSDYLPKSWTTVLHFIVRQRGRILWGWLLCVIIIIKAEKTSQRKFPAWSQNWLILCSRVKIGLFSATAGHSRIYLHDNGLFTLLPQLLSLPVV